MSVPSTPDNDPEGLFLADDLAGFNTRIPPALRQRVRLASVVLGLTVQDITAQALAAWLDRNAPAL